MPVTDLICDRVCRLVRTCALEHDDDPMSCPDLELNDCRGKVCSDCLKWNPEAVAIDMRAKRPSPDHCGIPGHHPDHEAVTECFTLKPEPKPAEPQPQGEMFP